MAELSPKAQKIYQYICERLVDGVPPTVREIGASLAIKSTSTVHKYLNELVDAGYITKQEGLNRSIQLENATSTVRVPLLGTVTAGAPILAQEEIVEYIPFKGTSSNGLFALRVRGDSMVNAAILDGDIVVVEKVPVAENGEIVVALIDNEATVKRFYKEHGHFRLQPENDAYEPIIVDEVAILGKVKAVIREY